MLREDKALKLIEVFIVCDDFCNALTHWQTQQGQPVTCRSGQLTDSEMLAITARAAPHFLPLLRSQMLRVLLPQLRGNATRLLFPTTHYL